MSCSVRAMREADVDRVVAIADSLPEAPHWPRAAYLAALDGMPRRIALVAEQEASIVGFAVASWVGRQAELESIVVASSAQGRRIGGSLLTQLIVELGLAGVVELDLEVRESNRAAVRLYERAGFREVGRRRAYYREPAEDAVLLRLGLM